MGKTLLQWKMKMQNVPLDPAERNKLYIQMAGMIKQDLEKGVLTDWGMYMDGSGGYGVSELSPKDIYSIVLKWATYCSFDAKPVLNTDEVIESAKKQ